MHGALDDLEQNEDKRGWAYPPLLKTKSEAADRSPSRTANVLRRLGLDEKRAAGLGVENRSCEPRKPPAAESPSSRVSVQTTRYKKKLGCLDLQGLRGPTSRNLFFGSVETTA